MIRRLIFGFVGLALLVASAPAVAGPFSGISGVTPGAPDNPIARSQITIFESTVVSYAPAPGVGANFQAYQTGFATLGDLYSPVASPNGSNVPFDRRYQPQMGTEPSSLHNGSASNRPFGGDIHDPTDTYGFIGIDQPGSITLGFSVNIFDGAGADFAVFENGFSFGGANSLLAELAYVEVSSNGIDFARFDSISLNTAATTIAGTFQGYDMTNVYNLAGKHASNWGTPFDLVDLSSHTLVTSGLLDLSAVRYVRLVDVIGSGPLYDSNGDMIAGLSRDSLGNPILDNWVTFDSGGFDYLGLRTGAVGVLNASAVPEPSTWALCVIGGGTLVAWRRRSRGSSRIERR